MSCAPTILTSVVTGPQSRTYFRIGTDTPTVGFTAFHNAVNQPMVIIEWAKHPIVEVRDILSKRLTSQWLALSPDRTHRTMEARGRHFVWVPSDGALSDVDCPQLYSSGSSPSQIFGRVSREEDTVTLELTTEAIQIGLLELCVTATFLLQCGRDID
ncbi:hypothetical protein B0H10DRAFT_2186748 [Mycena sp. CBHHK59/15]|nr:hypothetical protein B0H10DRAFT_2186748 [Mycena sp. CBHHK59/15]